MRKLFLDRCPVCGWRPKQTFYTPLQSQGHIRHHMVNVAKTELWAKETSTKNEVINTPHFDKVLQLRIEKKGKVQWKAL